MGSAMAPRGDSRPRVLIYDPIRDVPWDYEVERELLDAAGVDLLIPEQAQASDELLARSDVVVVSGQFPIGAMNHLDRCVGILCYSVGMDNVNHSAAQERGIPVANIAGYCTDEVSDHALALLLAFQRRLIPFAVEADAGNWDVYHRDETTQIRRLRGQVAGIIGVGRIGTQVAHKVAAFGMKVLGYDPFLAPADVDFLDLVGLDELLERSDVIVLCSALVESSRNLINAQRLGQMKPGATLVNIARGGLIDEFALAAALWAGHLGGAALDVRASEPPDAAHDPLRGAPNLIQTQHLGALSRESRVDIHAFAAQRIVELLVSARRIVDPATSQEAHS